MKCTEVRVGSLVSVSGKPYVIDANDIMKLQYGNILEERRYKPLLLTEDLLVKAGFVRSHFGYYSNPLLSGIIEFDEIGMSCEIYERTFSNIKYFHQLQDLAKVLLNVELKFI